MIHSEKMNINFFFTSLHSVLQNQHSENLGILLSVVAEILWLLFSIVTSCSVKYHKRICIQKLTTTMLRLMFFYSVYSQIPQQGESPGSTLQGGSREDLGHGWGFSGCSFLRCFPKEGLCHLWRKHTMTCEQRNVWMYQI